MLKGFKEFIMRGNVIDLAVAVVVGTAFTAVVNALVEAILNPALGALFNAEDLKTALPLDIPTVSGGVATLEFGALIAALIQFLLVAAAVYFGLVMPINYLRKRAEARRKAGVVEEEDAPPADIALLTEIRDLLARSEAASTATGKHAE